MIPHDLLANFETLAEAPSGIQRLRELVLELAVRGKLVEQDPGDEPAEALLLRIQASIGSSSLPKTSKRRNGRASAQGQCANDQERLPLPHGWCRVPLACLITLMDAGWSPACQGGATGSEEEWGVLKTTAIQINSFEPQHHKKLPPQLAPRPECEVKSGDLLVTRAGPWFRVGVCCYVSECRPRLMLSDKIIRCRLPKGLIDGRWIALCLNSGVASGYLRAKQTGMDAAQVNISQGRLAMAPIEVPPLAEQRRIVARVDELMALLDRLEAKRQEREAARAAARDSSLAALREAPTPDDGETAWLRIQERFHELFATPEDVASLQQAVLQLAVSGRLVERDECIGNAEALFDAIQGERRLMVKSGLIKAPKPCSSLTEDDLPFPPPKGWIWCRLGDLVSEGPSNGWSPTTVDYPTAVKTLALSATTKGWFDASRFKYVDAEVPPDSPLWLIPGDLLIQRSNTRDYVGMPAVFNGASGEFIYPDLMMRCRFPRSVSVQFMHLFLLSTYGRSFIQAKASGTSSSMVKVGQDVVRSIPIALPPAEEQLRILDAVAAFNQTFERLVVSIEESIGLSDSFAAAAVHHLDA